MNGFEGPLHGPTMRLPNNPARARKAQYVSHDWPAIQELVARLFKDPSSVSFGDKEKAVMVVQQCCVYGLKPTCYTNMLQLIIGSLSAIRGYLQQQNEQSFLVFLTRALACADEVIDGICTIFRYLDKHYVVPKLGCNLQEQMHKLYREHLIAEAGTHQRLAILLPQLRAGARQDGEWPSPRYLQQLISGLYHFHPEYKSYNMDLFSLYIPCLTPVLALEEEQRIIRMEYERLARNSSSAVPHTHPNAKRARRLTFS